MSFRKRNFRRSGYRDGHAGYHNEAVDAYNDNKFTPPQKEEISANSDLLQKKMFRDLDNLKDHLIEVKADPNTEMSYGAIPYTVIGQTSPVVGAKFPGAPNIAGNAIVTIQNDTTRSQLMNIFDVAVIYKTINYNYLPIKQGTLNLAYASETIKSIEQAISYGFSTMLTQLQFAQDSYSTDMPIPTQFVTSQAADPLDRVLAKSAGYYACLIHYQCVLQSLVQPISKYIEIRSLEKEAMRMSFRTEAPLVTQIFGLFKKKSFISEVNTIGTVVLNEYFDDSWYKQMNALQCVPSRKTKGMVNPLQTMVAIHSIPRLIINRTESDPDGIYDSDNLRTSATGSYVNPDTFEFETGSLGLEELITRVVKMMNIAYILRFVRKLNHNDLPADTDQHTYIHSVSGYVESIVKLMKAIAVIAAAFSTAMSNVRTFLDKLNQSGMVYWKKGVAFFVDRIEQLDPKYNVILDSIFAASYSGADKVIFDAQTKRWRAYAFWNKYTGIPEYDYSSGGAFLTLALRDIQTNDSAGHPVDFEGSSGLIPILFGPEPAQHGSMIVTRNGATSEITAMHLTYSEMMEDHMIARLNVMSDQNVSVKVPVIDASITNAGARAKFCSAAILFLGNVFGYGRTKTFLDGVTDYPDKILDPDYVAFIDLEIEDVSNQMIVFARNYAPFRVSTPDPKRSMGFIA